MLSVARLSGGLNVWYFSCFANRRYFFCLSTLFWILIQISYLGRQIEFDHFVSTACRTVDVLSQTVNSSDGFLLPAIKFAKAFFMWRLRVWCLRCMWFFGGYPPSVQVWVAASLRLIEMVASLLLVAKLWLRPLSTLGPFISLPNGLFKILSVTLISSGSQSQLK